MIASENSATSLRLARLDSSRLAWAFALSIALHLIFWGGYSLNKRYHFLDNLHLPAWVQKLMQPLRALVKKDEKKPLFQESEPPLMFVNVNPEQVTPEAPKDAKYYSSQNSKAANPVPDQETEVPKITGKQENVPQTEDAERNKFKGLQPSLPADKPEPEEQERPKPKLDPGDLALAKPENNPSTEAGTGEKKRPRRLADLPPEKQPRPPGQKMKQDGGVRRKLEIASLDAKATPFGAYDALLVHAISERWYDLLDNRDYAAEARGKVVLQFKLHYDGRITDMNVAENTVSETLSLICQKAVLDPSPFEKWSKEMRLMVGEDSRKIQFTFYYY